MRIHDRLIGWSRTLRDVEIAEDPLVSVGSGKRDLLALPVRIVLVDAFDTRVELRRVVPVETPIEPERLVRNRFLLAQIRKGSGHRRLELGLLSDVITHTTNAILGGAIPGAAGIQRGERPRRLVPCTAADIALAADRVPAPLFHIAGHVQRAEGANAFVGA